MALENAENGQIESNYAGVAARDGDARNSDRPGSAEESRVELNIIDSIKRAEVVLGLKPDVTR